VDFCETSGSIARKAETSQNSVQTYARLGLIEFITLENGTRLFKPDAVEKVRELKRQRLANRSRRR
jgi:DNA-binding transcriptional MerR regulator